METAHCWGRVAFPWLRGFRNQRKMSETKAVASTPHHRIGYFAMDGGEYQELLKDDCSQMAAQRGFGFRAFQASGNAMKQVAQIQACLREPTDRRPTLVVVSP